MSVNGIWDCFVNLPWPPVSLHTYASCLSVFVKPRYTKIHSFRWSSGYCTHWMIFFFWETSWLLFWFWHRESHSLSWPPLSLNTSDTRRYIWHPQLSPYPTTQQHQQMRNHMKTEEVTLETTPLLKRIYIPLWIKVFSQKTNANLHSTNSRPNPSKHTPPSTTKAWYTTSPMTH